MIKYFIMKRKMKRDEVMVKAMFYGTIASVVDEQKDIIGFVQRLYGALKDVSMEDLRSELVTAIATIVHEENKKTEE